MPRQTLQDLSQTRNNNFDFLRFAMACVVIHTHSYALAGVTYASTRDRLLHGDLGGATMAVNVFFLISGFLISNSFQHSANTLHYLKKRMLRIYPGFAMALAFCVFIVGPLAGVQLASYWTKPETYAFFLPLIGAPIQPLPGAFPDAPWSGITNSSLWTIRFEIFCYLLPPLLGLLGLFRRRLAILVLFIASLVAQNLEVRQIPARWDMFLPWFGNIWELPRFLSFFLAGMTYYAWRDSIPWSRTGLALAVVTSIVAVTTPLKHTLLPLSLPYLVFYFAFSRSIPLQHFGKRGDFSYGMYLYAFPIQQLLVRNASVARSPLVLTLLAGLATFAAAVLSWKLIEKPCLSLKNRGTGTGSGARPPRRQAEPAAMPNGV
jgi:peptidoglycan/LPS O-acetylase OafA/YrhL